MDFMSFLIAKFHYFFVVIIMMLGLWGMIAKKNLVKKCISMAIFQTGIILFYISMGAKKGATIPIIDQHGSGHDIAHASVDHGVSVVHTVVDATQYANPLTQILMLTAIVVGVATLGLALTLIQKIYEEYQTLNEDELLAAVSEEEMSVS